MRILSNKDLKYLDWMVVVFSIASSEPMPRYFFKRTPSWKKYSPGASVVPARREPIITRTLKFHIYQRSAQMTKNKNYLRNEERIQMDRQKYFPQMLPTNFVNNKK